VKTVRGSNTKITLCAEKQSIEGSSEASFLLIWCFERRGGEVKRVAWNG
jgi:hypothetical protein